MKRVCIVSYHQRMYDERAYWKVALSLSKMGYSLVRVAIAHHNDDASDTPNCIEIRAVQLPVFSKNAVLNYALRLVSFQTRRRRLQVSVLSQSADVYWLNDFRCHYLAPKIRKKYPNAQIIYDVIDPTVQQIIDNRPLPFANKFWAQQLSRSETKALPSFNHIVCTEPRLLHRYKQLCPQIPQSLLFNYTSLNNNLQLPDSTPIYDAIYCGLLSKNRGLWLMLDAISYLIQTNRNIKLLLLGPIDQSCSKQQIDERISDLHISENVLLHNAVEYNKVEGFYSKSAIGLLPFADTPSNRQILPIKLYEYLNFGLPVVAPNFGQMGEIVANYKVGLGVSMSNVIEFAEALWQLRQNIQLYRQHAFEVGTKNFRWDIQLNTLQSIIEGK